MKIGLKYFARIAELTGKKEEEFTFENDIFLQDLISFLISKYGDEFKSYLFDENSNEIKSFFKFIINGKLSEYKNVKISDNSEIIIIPPVSGG
ncbi:MAG: MoaD/ThiS family protein [Candidatus Lokiarchaeota archaeon]|nr:MoaD/ThiS family protein [Candidatus Lokiarchaeota archaeon]